MQRLLGTVAALFVLGALGVSTPHLLPPFPDHVPTTVTMLVSVALFAVLFLLLLETPFWTSVCYTAFFVTVFSGSGWACLAWFVPAGGDFSAEGGAGGAYLLLAFTGSVLAGLILASAATSALVWIMRTRRRRGRGT